MITIQGNPHKYEDFSIYLDGKEIVCWSSDEIKNDPLSAKVSKNLFSLFINQNLKSLKQLLSKLQT